MIIHETLEALDLSHTQTDIYLALLKLGPASIRDIALESGVNRGTTYEQLKVLHGKSVVSYVPRGKRRLFCAEPPECLLKLLDSKTARLSEASELLKQEIVPDLHQIRGDSNDTQVRHYEGDDGIEFVLRDILTTMATTTDPVYRVYSSKRIRKYLYRPFPTFTRQRVKQGIGVKVIAIGPGGEDAPLSERKWLDSGNEDPSASYVAVYKDKCAMISLTHGDHPIAVVIESAAIATALTLSFDALWTFL